MDRIVIRTSQPPTAGQPPRYFHLEDWPLSFNPPSGSPQQYPTLLTRDHKQPPYTTLRGQAQGTNLVEDAGRDLQTELDSNVDVSAALSHASSAGQRRPVFFQILSPDEELPWETIWRTPQNFFAYQVDSPVGRLISGSHNLSTRTLDQAAADQPPVLRVLAVLTAQHNPPYNISSDTEWDHLYDAKKGVEQNQHLEVELDVLVDDPNLENRIQRLLSRPADAKHGYVRLFTAKQDLKDRIELFRPHLLHFFCHGAIQNGSPHLLLGTDSGQMIRVTDTDILASLNKIKHDAWMCVLNCCQSGQSSASSRSFAKLLVGTRIPVVIGMAEPITTITAHAFTAAFYREVFDHIDSNIAAWRNGTGSPPWEAEWVEVMYDVRSNILEEHNPGVVGYVHKRDQKCWTLPVFYTVPAAFCYEVRSRSVAQQATASVTASVMETLRDIPGTPGGLLGFLTTAGT